MFIARRLRWWGRRRWRRERRCFNTAGFEFIKQQCQRNEFIGCRCVIRSELHCKLVCCFVNLFGRHFFDCILVSCSIFRRCQHTGRQLVVAGHRRITDGRRTL